MSHTPTRPQPPCRPAGRVLLRALAMPLLLSLASTACQDFASSSTAPPACSQTSLDCTTCHGDPATADPAPPRDTHGNTATSEIGVGAHQSHLASSAWHRRVECADCHKVPSRTDDVGHIDGGPAELTWGSLAQTDDASPTLDRSTATCSGVYCHGATLSGGINTTPRWTQVDGSQAACGTCHGLPPAAPHPQGVSDCSACHGMVVDAQRNFVNPSLHINGEVNLSGMACSSCHGSSTNPAPPVDTQGRSDTAEVTVGAHQAHLAPSNWHRQVQCGECHTVPTSVDAPGHIDAAPAEVTWSGVSVADGATPQFDRTAATCSGAYCHGATLSGGSNTTPRWTQVDGSQAACGTCHGLPPAAPHPQGVSDCSACHGMVVDAQRNFVDPSLHINGEVNVSGTTCSSCHGSSANPAPPVDTQGRSDTAEVTVGAHQAHLAPSNWHRQVQCGECHTVPTSVDAPGHIDAAPAEVTWSGVSVADGATPQFDRTAATCSGAYCHGATLLGPRAGGTVRRTPDWTVVDGTYSACGTTCHTNPPGGSHPNNTQCEACHGAVIASYNSANPSASTWADASRHVDGTVDVAGYHDLGGWVTPRGNPDHHGSNYFLTNQQRDEHNRPCTDCHGANLDGGWSGVSCDNLGCHGRDWRSCDFCHGTYPGQYNPPLGVGGETASNTLAVGRHEPHLTASTTHVAFACDTCHVVPATGDITHILGYVPSPDLQTPGHHGDVSLSGRAQGMSWDVTAIQGNPVTARGSCVGACHSDGRGGPPQVTPYWAGGAWNAGSCGNCHPAQPNTNKHQKHRNEGIACGECHPGASSGTHMDGQPTYSGSLTITWNDCGAGNAYPTCTGTCHGKWHNAKCWQ